MSEFVTTTKILNLPGSRAVVAKFAGMADLSAFDDKPDKLIALCDMMLSLDVAPPELDGYSLKTVHHAAGLVKAMTED